MWMIYELTYGDDGTEIKSLLVTQHSSTGKKYLFNPEEVLLTDPNNDTIYMEDAVRIFDSLITVTAMEGRAGLGGATLQREYLELAKENLEYAKSS